MAWLVVGSLFIDRLTDAWTFQSHHPLTDPLGYPALARDSRFFYDSGWREPLHIFLVKLSLPLWPPDDRALRTLTLVETFLLLPAVAIAARTRFGPIGALVAATALGSSRAIAYYSVQGLNITTYLLALALFTAAWLSASRGAPRGDFALGGAWGLLALARIEGLIVGALACTSELLFRRAVLSDRLARAARIGCTAFLLVTPSIAYQSVRFGNPFHTQAVQARFWSNTIAMSRGEIPWSDVRDFGGPVSPIALLMRDGPLGAVEHVASGYRIAFTRDLWRLMQGAEWSLILAAIGAVGLLATGDFRLPVLLLCVLVPSVPILELDQVAPGSGVEVRFLLPALIPILGLAAAAPNALKLAARTRLTGR